MKATLREFASDPALTASDDVRTLMVELKVGAASIQIREGHLPGSFDIRSTDGTLVMRPIVSNEIVVSVAPH